MLDLLDVVPKTAKHRPQPRLVKILGVCAIGYGVLGALAALVFTIHTIELRSMFPLTGRSIGGLLLIHGVAGVTIAAGVGILRAHRWARLTLLWLGSLSLGMAVLWVALVAVAVGSLFLSPKQSRVDAVTGAALGDAVIIAIARIFVTILPLAAFLFGLTRPSVRESCCE